MILQGTYLNLKKLFDGIEKLSDKAARKLIEDAKKQLAALVATGKISADLAKEVSDALDDALDDASESLSDRLPDRLRSISSIFGSMASSVRELNSELADTLENLSGMLGSASDLSTAFANFAKTNADGTNSIEGDIAGIQSLVSALEDIFKTISASIKSKKEAKQQVLDFQSQLIAGEEEYNLLIRERERQQVIANKSTLQGLKDQNELLIKQKNINEQIFNELLKKLQSESFITGLGTKKTGGSGALGLVGALFGFGRKTEVTQELESLAGKTFEEMEKLFLSGQLTDSAKALFEQLQKIKAEGVDIDALLRENKLRVQELFTGTTADSIADTIIQGFEQGFDGVEDFVDGFRKLMQNAMLQVLKIKYLEGPLKQFFEDFATASESDGQLTTGEIDRLQGMYNTIIENAANQFEQLQQVAGINFGDAAGTANTLTGAIRGMTEQQAELLAGQFGAQRITMLDQLMIARTNLTVLQNIESNTARLVPMYELWRRLELHGLKAI